MESEVAVVVAHLVQGDHSTLFLESVAAAAAAAAVDHPEKVDRQNSAAVAMKVVVVDKGYSYTAVA